MERTQGQAFRQSGVLVVVFAGHVLLLLLFISSSRHSNARKALARAETRAVLLLLDMEQRAEPPPVKQTPETPRTASASRTRKDRPRQTPSEVPGDNGEASESAAITAPGESRRIPKIDWQLEMGIAVQAMTPKMVKEEEHRCAQAERTHAARPFGCKTRYYDKPWRPSGDLLKDMRDPNRPRSSVPDPLPDAFGKLPRAEVLEEPE
jgi:hypothetical protein